MNMTSCGQRVNKNSSFVFANIWWQNELVLWPCQIWA